MMYGNPVTNGVIKRLPGGELRVKLPDGSIEHVAAHRPDIAMHLASGLIRPTGRKKPRPAKATTSSGFTLQQVDTLGAALKPLMRKIHDRLEALEHKLAGKTTSKAPDRPTTRRTALARAGDALERADAVLRRQMGRYE